METRALYVFTHARPTNTIVVNPHRIAFLCPFKLAVCISTANLKWVNSEGILELLRHYALALYFKSVFILLPNFIFSTTLFFK